MTEKVSRSGEPVANAATTHARSLQPALPPPLPPFPRPPLSAATGKNPVSSSRTLRKETCVGMLPRSGDLPKTAAGSREEEEQAGDLEVRKTPPTRLRATERSPDPLATSLPQQDQARAETGAELGRRALAAPRVSASQMTRAPSSQPAFGEEFFLFGGRERSDEQKIFLFSLLSLSSFQIPIAFYFFLLPARSVP